MRPELEKLLNKKLHGRKGGKKFALRIATLGWIIGLITLLALGYQIYAYPLKELITDTSLWLKILILLNFVALAILTEGIADVCNTIEVTDLVNAIEEDEAQEANRNRGTLEKED